MSGVADQLREELNAITEVNFPTPRFPRDESKRRAPIQESGTTPQSGTGVLPPSSEDEGGSTKSFGSVPVVKTARGEPTVDPGAPASSERGRFASPVAVGGRWEFASLGMRAMEVVAWMVTSRVEVVVG